MSKVHLCEKCTRIPMHVKHKLNLYRTDGRRAVKGKEYWSERIRALGVYEDPVDGCLRVRQRGDGASEEAKVAVSKKSEVEAWRNDDAMRTASLETPGDKVAEKDTVEKETSKGGGVVDDDDDASTETEDNEFEPERRQADYVGNSPDDDNRVAVDALDADGNHSLDDAEIEEGGNYGPADSNSLDI